MEMAYEWIQSLKLSEPAEKLQILMLMVANFGIEKSAFAFKIEESRILEIVSRYRAATGSRLERLKKREDEFQAKQEFIQELDLKGIEEEWDQIYTLCNEIEENYGRMKTREEELENVRDLITEKVEYNEETLDEKEKGSEDVSETKGGNNSKVCIQVHCSYISLVFVVAIAFAIALVAISM